MPGCEPPDEEQREVIDHVELVLGGLQPKYIAEPLSSLVISTRDPWTEDGADPAGIFP